MMELENSNTFAESEDSFRLQDYWGLIVPRWSWFVISLVVCMTLAVLYLMCTPSIYTRSASILIKDDAKNGGGNNMMTEFSDLSIFQSKTNINNELFTLQSPTLMEEVVRRLRLHEIYTTRRGLMRVELYKTSPVSIVFQNDSVQTGGFTIKLQPDSLYTLTDFAGYPEVEGLNGRLNEVIKTPMGDLVVAATSYYQPDYKGNSIHYCLADTKVMASAYSSGLTAAQNLDKASIINLSFSDASIQKAEDLLNTLIVVYNEKWIQDKNQVAVSTSQFISDRLAVIENELGNVDNDISSYKSQHLMPDVQAVSSLYMNQSVASKKELEELNIQLKTARRIRKELESKEISQPLPANSGLSSSNIEGQITEYNNRVLDRNRLLASSSEKNPLVMNLTSSLNSTKLTIISSLDNLIKAIEMQINSVAKQEAKATDMLASNPNQAKYLLTVERQQKVKEELYLYLLQKREENELSQAFTAYNTRVVIAPRGSDVPASPKRSQILLMAFAIGLTLPAGLIFLIEYLNNTVRGRKDVERLNIPLIGEIPFAYNEKNRGKSLTSDLYRFSRVLKFLGIKPKFVEDEEFTIVVKEGKRDIVNEAFRVLRTNLEFMMGKNSNEKNVLILTSFNPGSGKSFLNMNIAMSLAIKNKKILVIDGDMRHASLSGYVGKPSIGISDYLGHRISDYKQCIISYPGYDSLHVMPVGTIPPNPSELLFDDRFDELIAKVRKEYDYVFIDTPPIDIVADASIIEKQVDRTIFVVRAGLLDRAMLPDLQKIYLDKRFKNLSLILNGTVASHGRYGYKYGYRYGYQYGGYYGSKES